MTDLLLHILMIMNKTARNTTTYFIFHQAHAATKMCEIITSMDIS